MQGKDDRPAKYYFYYYFYYYYYYYYTTTTINDFLKASSALSNSEAVYFSVRSTVDPR